MQNTTTRTTAGNPAERLLCRCACVVLDDAAGDAIREACREQREWSRTIREAELHGMAPWLHMRIRRAGGPGGEVLSGNDLRYISRTIKTSNGKP